MAAALSPSGGGAGGAGDGYSGLSPGSPGGGPSSGVDRLREDLDCIEFEEEYGLSFKKLWETLRWPTVVSASVCQLLLSHRVSGAVATKTFAVYWFARQPAALVLSCLFGLTVCLLFATLADH